MVKARVKSKAEGNEMKRGREKNYIRCLHGTKSTSVFVFCIFFFMETTCRRMYFGIILNGLIQV